MLHYHKYLQKVSKLGLLYKRFFLHPFLLKLAGNVFLDVGCGIGLLLKSGSSKAVGLDINKYNVNQIKDQGLNAILIPESGIFPVEDNSFSSVIIDQVIEHLEDPKYVLKEIDRVLSSPGNLIVGLPLERGFQSDPDHVHFYTPASAIDLIENQTNLFHKKTIYYPLPYRYFGKLLRQQSFYLLFETSSY